MISFSIERHSLRPVNVVVIKRDGETIATLCPGADQNSVSVVSGHIEFIEEDSVGGVDTVAVYFKGGDHAAH